MPLDFLFRRSEQNQTDWHEMRRRREPRLELPRPTVPEPGRPPLPQPAVAGAPMPDSDVMVRHMSPRQMADWAHEMYMIGWITWDEYRSALPMELHPGYNATVGALTGELAEPDRSRDMLQELEERLAFAQRHVTGDDSEARRLQRVVALLRWLATPQYLVPETRGASYFLNGRS